MTGKNIHKFALTPAQMNAGVEDNQKTIPGMSRKSLL